MLDTLKKILISSDKLVILPVSDKDYLDSFNFMFDDCVVIFDDNLDIYSELSKMINESSIKNLYIVNFFNLYRKILPEIKKNITVNEIFLCSIANLTSSYILPIFYDISEFYERKLIHKIYALDKSAYEILKRANFNVEQFVVKLPFDEKKVFNNNFKSIGILSHDYDPVHNFYDMLTAVSMVKDYDVVKFMAHMDATHKFFDYFDIRHKFCQDINEVMNNNFVNLYCNFTNTNTCLVLKSMDNGIPCLLGNTDLFDNNKILKELLVLKSDDDVNEIAYKINKVRENYDLIYEEYKKWRKDFI